MRAERPRGFILPTTLLVLTLLTVMLTAAFVLISAEYRSTDNAMAGTRAQALGQAALNTYFASSHSLLPTDTYDSVRYTYTGGYADVVAKKMINATTGSTRWVIKSTGTSTDPLLTGQVTARRTIGQMATLNPAAALNPRAALVALNGVSILGSAAGHPLNGTNYPSSPGGCSAPGLADTNALLTLSGGSPGGYTGSTPSGGVITQASIASLYDSTHIDWPAIQTGNFTPDYIANGTNPTNLPAPGSNTWEVGYYNGDLTIPGNLTITLGPPATTITPRVGVLIVTGNVTMANNASWAGILIVGGRLIAGNSGNGNFLVQGYTITGLNCAIGGSCANNQFNRWSSTSVPATYREVRWSWCYTNLALQSLNVMVPVKNTFIDNWAGY